MSTGRGLDAGGLKYRLGISQFATKDRVVAFIFSFFFQDDMGNEALMRSLIHARLGGGSGGVGCEKTRVLGSQAGRLGEWEGEAV